jgi:hypothetical protein
MTLGETRDQISQLEVRLAQLKDEKHQLFLQLKKVLNEDDNRRRQLIKESRYVIINILASRNIFLASEGKVKCDDLKFSALLPEKLLKIGHNYLHSTAFQSHSS